MRVSLSGSEIYDILEKKFGVGKFILSFHCKEPEGHGLRKVVVYGTNETTQIEYFQDLK